MKKAILRWILRVARCLGLFAITRYLTRKDLRILGYHGAALHDEDGYSPGLFMKGRTFVRRMEYLAKQRYPVIGLNAALDGLARDSLPDGATVVTIDDGWYGSFSIMAPVLQRHSFPATFYVSTYYVERQTQVFNVVLGYVLWKAGARTLDLSLLAGELAGLRDLGDRDQRHEAYESIDAYGESLSGAADRQRLIQALCKVLDVHWPDIEQKRVASFVNVDELRRIAGRGIDVQLHTHRHRFPHDSFEAASFEIEENRRVLSAITDRPLEHFCYPSGSYRKEQLPWFAQLGIRSATTTKRGFNRRNQNAFELRRFLDSESVSQLEFEAEMSGFFEVIRRFGYSI